MMHIESKNVENILHYLLWEIQLKLVNTKCLYIFNLKKQYNHEVLILEDLCDVLGMAEEKSIKIHELEC